MHMEVCLETKDEMPETVLYTVFSMCIALMFSKKCFMLYAVQCLYIYKKTNILSI